jgi:hypothetical protein
MARPASATIPRASPPMGQDIESQAVKQDDAHRHPAHGQAPHGDVTDGYDTPPKSTRLMGDKVGAHRE